VWLESPSRDSYLFKYVRQDSIGSVSGDDWAEKLAAELAGLLGFQPLRSTLLTVLATPGSSAAVFDVWAGYLVFDAWIANADRHHENWGVLVDRRDGSRRLAPSFDHGSSLGFNEPPSGMATKVHDARALERWCDRGRSGHFAGRPDLVDVAAAALELAGRDGWSHWMARLRRLRREEWTAVIGRVPAARMSEDARTFVGRVLDINRRRLLDVCDRAA
jgi:hypothetical protein